MADVNLGTAEGRITIDSSGAKKGAADASAAVKESAKEQEKAATRLKDTGNTAAKAYGIAVVGGLALAINAAKNFDQALANVAAAGGKEAAGAMDRIREKALQLGHDTIFSATESASAMEALIKAGLSVDDVLGGAADAAVNLAAAESIDLTNAAEIAATAMTAFNLKASDMPAIANKISQAASATKMDVNDFAQAMNQAGAVSKLVGLSFDDMTLAITAMAKAGIVGSDAGTSLKTFLMNLQPQTKQQKKLFDELGITTDGMANKFFDANGKIKSMTDIAGVLSGALKGMTDAQKQQTLETLFGSDAIRAAAIIAGQGAEGMKNLTAEMNGQLTVAEKAKVKQDTLAGSVEKMKGAVDAAAISFGTVLIPVLRDLAGALETVAGWFGSLPGPVQKAIVWFGVISVSLLGFGFAAVKTVKLVKDINTVFGLTKGLSTFSSGIGTAKTALQVWAIDAAAASKRGAIAVGSAAKSVAVSFATMVASAARATASMIATAAVHTAQWIRMAAVAMARAAMIAAAWLIANPWLLIAIGIAALVALVILNWDKIVSFLTTVWNWIKNLAITVFTAIKDFFVFIFQAYIGIYIWAWNTIWDFLTMIWGKIKDLAVTVFTAIKDFFVFIFTTVRDFFVGLWNEIWGFLTGLWTNIKDTAVSVFTTIKDFFTGVFTSISNFIRDAWNGLISFLVDAWNRIKDGVVQAFNEVVDFFKGLSGKIIGAFGDFGRMLWDIGKGIIEGLIKGIESAVGWLMDRVRDIGNGIKNAFSAVLSIFSPSKVFEKFGKFTIQGYVIGVEKAKADAFKAVQQVAANVGLESGFPSSAVSAASSATTTNYGANVNVQFTVYNPSAEPASDTAARKMRTLAAMGAFG